MNHKMIKIRYLVFFVSIFLSLCISHFSFSQTWKPEKNIEIVAGSAAGGSQDRTARLMQKILKDHSILTSVVNVVNKPGGGGAISNSYVAQHPGDAHFIALGSPSFLINYMTGRSPLNYKDFTPLALLFGEYMIIATRLDSPINNVSNLVLRLKQQPEPLSVAVATTRGGMQHIAVGLLAKSVGIHLSHFRVAIFNSGSESITAVMGGHINIVATAAANAAPHIVSGRLKGLGVTAPKRLLGALNYVPTLTEQGYNVVVSNWRSVVGPKGLTVAQVVFWDTVLGRMVQTPEWIDSIKSNYWVDHYLSGQSSNQYFEQQYKLLHSALADVMVP